jgi:putative restriction endonuclease|tara:strand:+ start:1594 stop:2730 length:1137 start_codon:yes stop_codon:yes gene_type:complete
MATWKEDIIKALENLGGVAHLSKIYKEVERIREGNLNPTWDRTIQRELETNSSDSEAFKKDRKGDDLFYMAEGKGKGVWGLRNFDDGKLFFGELENIKVGQIFKDRDELSKARVHGPTMSGIWGRESEGACSIVLSGGYEDDIDDLNYILYTGQGGQDKPGGKQVSNQEFVRGNKALVLSQKYNLPVRVTRGHQIPNGPIKGYRYDGLYYVNKFERIKGKGGFYICRFYLSSEKEIEKLETELKPTLKPDYKRTERSASTVNRLKRNVKLSEEIKKIYEYKCQVCSIFLKTPSGAIAIGAHIKGLGKPHNGPDVIENMICLCPNHHEQFDDYGYYIDPETYEIKGLKDFEGKKITINKKHNIDKEFFEYHSLQYKKNN